jgi:hypothetical protein
VIEKPIREALGVEPGFISVQSLVGDHVEIRFHPAEHGRSLRGILASAAKRQVPPEQWPEAREEAWANGASADWLDGEKR